MIQTTSIKESTLFNVLTILMVFRDPLQGLFPPFQYFDELFALCVLPLFVFVLVRNNFRYVFRKRFMQVYVLLLLFVVAGLINSIRFRLQPIPVAFKGLFLDLKFFMSIATGYLLFEHVDYRRIYEDSWGMLKGLTIFLFGADVLDLVLHIFPASLRAGLRSEQLFYSHPTFLAGACVLLCAIFFRMHEFYGMKTFPYVGMLLVVAVSTLRVKAIGAVVCMFFIYVIVCCRRREFGFLTWCTLGASVLLVSIRQFAFYFYQLGKESGRIALTRVSFMIARDYFPLGAGFGTFGSAASVDPYSRVYSMYHIDHIWGLSRRYNSFISDCFWPMILGETGYVGLLLYGIILFLMMLSIYAVRKRNAYSFASALAIILYLIISSTSESAFVNPIAVSFGFLLGVLFCEKDIQA